MNQRRAMILSKVIVFVALIISLWVWPLLPADALIAIHFDMEGKVNNYASKMTGLLLMPAIMLGFSTLFCLLPVIEPRKFNLDQSRGSYLGIWFIILLFLLYIHVSILGFALEILDTPLAGLSGVISVLFFLIGAQIKRAKSNFFIGVRTPWTLSSEFSWIKTNQKTGFLFQLLGFFGLVAALLFGQQALTWIIYVAIAIAVYGVIISYVYWRFDTNKYDK